MSNYIACGARFGFCDLNTQIRFVKGFLGCTLKINFLQYLLMFFAAKTCAYFVIALLIFFVSIVVHSNIAIYAISGGIIAAEVMLYFTVERFSVISPIKYLNITALLQTNDIFGNYNTINFFGYPLGLAFSSIFFAVIITAALAIMATLCFVLYGQFRIYIEGSDMQFRQYVEMHGGVVTKQTDEFIVAETERLNRLPDEVARQSRDGFNIFADHYEYAKENNTEIVYDTGYALLFDRRTTALELLFQFIFMAVVFAPVFSSDSRTVALISSTKHGRKHDIAVRGAICAVTAAIMFAAAHLPIILRIAKRCGFEHLGAPVQSIVTLHGFPLNCTILQYMILRYSVLLVISLTVMAVMLAVSHKVKSVSACTVLLMAVFAVPCVGVMMI